MRDRKKRVCPVERVGKLDNRIRRWFQNPVKLLKPYIEEGMTVLDLGCGPGFFSVDLVQMVGASGRVIAVDLQEGMLRKLEDKIKGTDFESRITLHQCREDRIGISDQVDFGLAFYMVHEVPDQENFFKEIEKILKPKGRLFVVEPPFHVSKSAFQEMVRKAQNKGLAIIDRPKVFLSQTALFKKG